MLMRLSYYINRAYGKKVFESRGNRTCDHSIMPKPFDRGYRYVPLSVEEIKKKTLLIFKSDLFYFSYCHTKKARLGKTYFLFAQVIFHSTERINQCCLPTKHHVFTCVRVSLSLSLSLCVCVRLCAQVYVCVRVFQFQRFGIFECE